MKSKYNKQSGFTLVEVLVWIILTAIIALALSGLFSSLVKNYMYGQRRYNVQQTANLVLLNISNNLRYGSDYKIQDYNQSINGKALYYKSIRPDESGTFLYYIDKTDFLFYRVPSSGGTPALVPGHTFVKPTDIQLTAIPSTSIFDGDTTHINISIRVTDTMYNQYVDETVMVIPINSFVK